MPIKHEPHRQIFRLNNHRVYRKGVSIFFDRYREDDEFYYFYKGEVIVGILAKRYCRVVEDAGGKI